MDYRNGCTGAAGCPGAPTHIYIPQGGFPVGYCVSCAPLFIKKRISTLPTTEAFTKLTEKVVEDMASSPETHDEPSEPAEPQASDVEDAAEETPAPKKPRRTRRKSTTTSEETSDTSDDE